jgi:hypothetical protein
VRCALGAPRGAVEQAGEDLGPLGGPDRERVVDHGQPRRRERVPLDGARQQLLVLRVVPGAQQVPGAEQLGGGMVADGRLAQQQAVEDEQSDGTHAVEGPRPGDPAPAGDVQRPRVQPVGGLAGPPLIQAARELRIKGEKLD